MDLILFKLTAQIISIFVTGPLIFMVLLWNMIIRLTPEEKKKLAILQIGGLILGIGAIYWMGR